MMPLSGVHPLSDKTNFSSPISWTRRSSRSDLEARSLILSSAAAVPSGRGGTGAGDSLR